YLDMIGRCLREDSVFGVALIVAGREAGGPARTTEIGTSARVVDFEQLEGGLLGITARGERRFRIASVERLRDGLHVAQVDWLPVETTMRVPAELQILAELMKQAYEQIVAQMEAAARDTPGAVAVAQAYAGAAPRFD